MADFDDLRRMALSLPGAQEAPHRGGPAFRVNNRKFALWWAEGARVIMRLSPPHQIFLFELRADAFAPCRVGTATWSFVAIEQLERGELEALVLEAWMGVAPRSLSRAHAARAGA